MLIPLILTLAAKLLIPRSDIILNNIRSNMQYVNLQM